MDNCKHVSKISPSRDHSILNPQKWLCAECGTTESVWACLSCSYVACGRYILEHAFDHYKQTKHPLAIEVNDKYVYCYECDEYVLNDNAAGDIKILRSALSAIATQSFADVEGRGKRLLRSHSFSGFSTRLEAEKHMRNEDLSFTAVKFRRYYTLAKAFGAWKHLVLKKRPPPKAKEEAPSTSQSAQKPASPSLRKRAFIPGVTGLRNLGNTCYMNSILQVLSHLEDFREFFLALRDAASADLTPLSTPSSASLASASSSAQSLLAHRVRVAGGKVKVTADSRPVSSYTRQSTIECFQHINSGKKPRVDPRSGAATSSSSSRFQGGLNGGATSNSMLLQRMNTVTLKDKNTNLSLSEELHALFRVLWSGRWAIVSPHKMLDAVWSIIPFFKGYTQQDAQEFLCELLDKVQSELGVQYPGMVQVPEAHFSTANFISHLFQGQLVSQVKCLRCKNTSETHEPFMDLSLEFPDVYHTQPVSKQASKQCSLQDMLAKFTETENLGEIYSCEKCNKRRKSVGSTLKTEAEKRFMIDKLPRVLRLHLKRFKWLGRNNRGKISKHVRFGAHLDMADYSTVKACRETSGSTVYQLNAVVMHHGRGFGSGHYTAYCLNKESGKRKDSWIHCNDARMQRCSLTDVMSAQAYILFYMQLDSSNKHINQSSVLPSAAQTERTSSHSSYASAHTDCTSTASWTEGAASTSQSHKLYPQPGGSSSSSGSSSGRSRSRKNPSDLTEVADDEITFNFRNSAVPRFHGDRKRKSSTGSSKKPELKRRKTVQW